MMLLMFLRRFLLLVSCFCTSVAFVSPGVGRSGIFFFASSTTRSSSGTCSRLRSTATDYQSKIDVCNELLTRAAETKAEDPDQVFEALSDLEKLMRQKCREEPDAAPSVLEHLNGSWRLVFTTGTADSQKKLGARINYFPLKAVQSFDTSTTPFSIENGIYLGDFCVIQFFGNFEFNLKSRKLEFDFDQIAIFGLKINLKQGQAAQMGASTGLGSESNVENVVKRNKKPFFNWIAADGSIATARGGGGGLALWKRVVVEEP